MKLITRTIESRKINAVCVNSTTKAMEEHTVTIPVDTPEKDLARAVNAALPVGTFYAYTATETIEENLYVMPEETFLKYAEKRPPRGTKETENTEEENG